MPSKDRADARTRIQQVALELFTEYGYDKTSLREIAARLGVTKAALYYYFKGKDDIVESLVDDMSTAVDEIVDWARTNPSTPQTRRELIEKYSEVIRAQGASLMRFLMENQPALREHKAGEAMRSRMKVLIDFVADPSDPLPVQMCGRMALFAVHGGPMIMEDVEAPAEEIFDAACDVAMSMLAEDRP